MGIKGLVAATYTPLNDDFSLNLSVVPSLVEHAIDSGCVGIYVCGSTGEGVSLSEEERKAVAEAYMTAVAKRVPVFIQVGANSLQTAQNLATHAESIGADYISANAPSYFKITDAKTMVDSMAMITAGAPNTPFYYYSIPFLTGAAVDAYDFLVEAHESGKIPTLAGIKYTEPKTYEFYECQQYAGGKYDILWGYDEMLLAGLVAGAKGGVGSTYNLAAPLYQSIIDAYNAGDMDLARELQHKSWQMVKIVNRHAPLHTSMKAVLKMIGLEVGPVRLPQKPLPEGAAEKIRADLEAIGFFDWRK